MNRGHTRQQKRGRQDIEQRRSTTKQGPAGYAPDAPLLIDGPSDGLVREKPKKKRTKQKYRNLQLWFNGALMVATVLTGGVVLFQNVILKWTLDEMRRQGDAIVKTYDEIKKQTGHSQSSAQAATDGVNVARDNFRIDLRPYVWIQRYADSRVKIGDPILVNIHFTNIGRSPAMEVLTDVHATFGPDAFAKVDRTALLSKLVL